MKYKVGYKIYISDDGVTVGCRDITREQVKQIDNLFKNI